MLSIFSWNDFCWIDFSIVVAKGAVFDVLKMFTSWEELGWLERIKPGKQKMRTQNKKEKVRSQIQRTMRWEGEEQPNFKEPWKNYGGNYSNWLSS